MSDIVELAARQFQRAYYSAAPTTGTWQVGDIVTNDTPAAGEPTFWVCTAAGTPGTWVPVGFIPASSVSTVAAAAAVTPADSLVNIDTGAFNLTLTAPTSVQVGSTISICNDSAGAVTLIPGTGVTIFAGSTTLAANTQAQLRATSVNFYYRIA